MDFNVYFEAVKILLAGQNPYLHLITMPGPFNYPPTSFLFLIFIQNRLIFEIFSILAFFVSIYLLTNKKLLLSIFLYGIFHFSFFPLKFNYGMGQINNFILLFIVLAYYYNPIFLAYAIGIKLVPVIYLYFYFIKKDYKKIFLTLLFVMVFWILSLFIIKFDFQKIYFLDVFWRAFGEGGKDVYYNQSLAGLLARSNVNIYFPLSLIFLIITWVKGRKLSKDRVFSAVTCLMLISFNKNNRAHSYDEECKK